MPQKNNRVLDVQSTPASFQNHVHELHMGYLLLSHPIFTIDKLKDPSQSWYCFSHPIIEMFVILHR